MASTEQSFSEHSTDAGLRSSLQPSDDNVEQQPPSHFRQIDGRQYHSNDPNTIYPFPSNRIEGNNDKRLHDLFTVVCGRNFKAPVDLRTGNARVLDVGCGAGWWTFDMAREFRSAVFTGIDMASLFPQTGNPPNVQFVEHNVLEGLPFENDTFDFVFQRNAATSYTQRQWAEIVVPELIRVTRPNGWVELTEPESSFVNSGTVTQRVTSLVNAFYQRNDLDMKIVENLPRLLEATGQISSTQRHVCVFEYGNRAAVQGERLRHHFRSTMLSMKSKLIHGMMDDHFEALVETAMIEMARKNTRISWHHLVFQKRA